MAMLSGLMATAQESVDAMVQEHDAAADTVWTSLEGTLTGKEDKELLDFFKERSQAKAAAEAVELFLFVRVISVESFTSFYRKNNTCCARSTALWAPVLS